MLAFRIFVLLVLFILTFDNSLALKNDDGRLENPWFVSLLSLLHDCPVKTARIEKNLTPSHKFVKTLADCARSRTLVAIDNILEDDVIPIVDGLELVKYKMRDDGGGNVESNGSITFSIRKLFKRVRDKGQVESEDNENLRTWLTNRLSRVLRTHVIKIDVERLRPNIPSVSTEIGARSSSGSQVEPRGRRRRRRQMQMIPIIMMGVLLMGSVLIPMGFQFLAVLGGKALILAKMALMLSSIQGLKKIATNGVNYGLYHTPVPEAWHERSTAGQFDLPYGSAGAAVPYVENVGYLTHRRSGMQST